MGSKRPSSPTSLLWAHRLRRENGFLLKRVRDVEISLQNQEKLITNTTAATESIVKHDIASLTNKVNVLEQSGTDKRLEQTQTGLSKRLDVLAAISEATTIQVSAIQDREKESRQQRTQDVTMDNALIERIRDVEQGLKDYAKSLNSVGEKINGPQMQKTMDQLDALTKRVTREGERTMFLQESIEKLEWSNTELKKANTALEGKLKKQQSRPVNDLAAADAGRNIQQDELQAPTNQDPGSVRPKRSQGWARRRSDEEDFDKGADLTVNARPKRKSAPKGSAAASIPEEAVTKTRPKKPVRKGPVPKAPRKSKRTIGGQADRDVIAASAPSGSRKRTRSSSVLAEGPPPKRSRQTAEGKNIRRAGKGWIEIDEDIDEEEEIELPINRPVDRPRRTILQSDPLTQGDSARTKKRGPRMPTLRPDELELISQQPLARQTRAGTKIETEEPESTDLSKASRGTQRDTFDGLRPSARAAPPPDSVRVKRKISQSDEE